MVIILRLLMVVDSQEVGINLVVGINLEDIRRLGVGKLQVGIDQGKVVRLLVVGNKHQVVVVDIVIKRVNFLDLLSGNLLSSIKYIFYIITSRHLKHLLFNHTRYSYLL